MNGQISGSQKSVMGRLGLSLTIAVIVLQVWAIGWSTYSTAIGFEHQIMFMWKLRFWGCFLPFIIFSAYAATYYVIVGRISETDLALSRKLFWAWGISVIYSLLVWFSR